MHAGCENRGVVPCLASDWQEGHGVREQKISYKLTCKTFLALSHKHLRELFKKAAGISKSQTDGGIQRWSDNQELHEIYHYERDSINSPNR